MRSFEKSAGRGEKSESVGEAPAAVAPETPRRRRVRWAIAIVALIVIAVFGAVWLQRKILFPREMIAAGALPARPADAEQIWIASDDGPVEAWFLPGDGVSEASPGATVLFAHGNGELIDHWPTLLARYRAWGMNLVLAEYRGYGRSAGSPSEEAIAADLDALVRRLRNDRRVDATRLVYHGRSLGGGAVCTLLEAHPPRALILESTFTSVTDAASDAMGIPGFLIVDKFENLEAVRGFDGALLVFHGSRDRVIPTAHGRRMAAAHPSAELVIYNSGHNDLPPPGSDYWERIERFIRQNEALTP